MLGKRGQEKWAKESRIARQVVHIGNDVLAAPSHKVPRISKAIRIKLNTRFLKLEAIYGLHTDAEEIEYQAIKKELGKD